jgi:hypothetical protein
VEDFFFLCFRFSLFFILVSSHFFFCVEVENGS